MYDTDDEFAEIMSSNFRAIRELTHVDEAVIVAQIQDLLHSDDDDLRAAGIRCFEKYVTSNQVARQRAAAQRIAKARRFLTFDEGEPDVETLRRHVAGARKLLDRVLADGAARARETAVATMDAVRDGVGLLAPVL